MFLEDHRRMRDRAGLCHILGLQPPRLPPSVRRRDELLVNDLALMPASESPRLLDVVRHESRRDFQPDTLGQRELVGLVRRDGVACRIVHPKGIERLIKPLEGGRRLRVRETLVRRIHPRRRPEGLRTPPPHRADGVEVEHPAAAPAQLEPPPAAG